MAITKRKWWYHAYTGIVIKEGDIIPHPDDENDTYKVLEFRIPNPKLSPSGGVVLISANYPEISQKFFASADEYGLVYK